MHVPEGWKKDRLGKYVEIHSGGAPSSLNLTNKGKYPYVKVEDMNNCLKYQLLSREYVNDDLKPIPKYSVLFPKRGAAILNNKVRIAATEFFIDSNMMALEALDDRLDSEFLYYTLTNEKLFKIADTSTIPQINNKHINPYLLLFPPFPEQQKIAKILSTWDKAIEKLEALIAAKQKRKKALMQRLLTGKMRFAGFDTEWKKCKLADIGTFAKGNGITKDDLIENGLPCIRYGEIYTTHHNYIRKFISFIPQEIAKNGTKLQKGDLLFAGSGETSEEIGKCVAYLDNQEAYAGGDIIIFRPFNDDSKYLGYLMNDDTMAYQKARVGQGHSVVHISAKNLSRLHLSLPSIEEQQKIASVLSTADTEIEIHQKQLSALKEQKKGLMQQLLTGKKRIQIETEV